jgi:drug/metabolite transporter (DMT)-like permease
MQNVLLLLVILGWGFGFFLDRVAASRISPWWMNNVFTITAIVLIPLYKIIYDKLGIDSSQFTWYGAFISVVAFVFINIATTALLVLYKTNNAAGILTNMTNLYTVVVLGLSVLFFGEQVNWYQRFGILLMIIASCLMGVR